MAEEHVAAGCSCGAAAGAEAEQLRARLRAAEARAARLERELRLCREELRQERRLRVEADGMVTDLRRDFDTRFDHERKRQGELAREAALLRWENDMRQAVVEKMIWGEGGEAPASAAASSDGGDDWGWGEEGDEEAQPPAREQPDGPPAPSAEVPGAAGRAAPAETEDAPRPAREPPSFSPESEAQHRALMEAAAQVVAELEESAARDAPLFAPRAFPEPRPPAAAAAAAAAAPAQTPPGAPWMRLRVAPPSERLAASARPPPAPQPWNDSAEGPRDCRWCGRRCIPSWQDRCPTCGAAASSLRRVCDAGAVDTRAGDAAVHMAEGPAAAPAAPPPPAPAGGAPQPPAAPGAPCGDASQPAALLGPGPATRQPPTDAAAAPEANDSGSVVKRRPKGEQRRKGGGPMAL
eukprot:TRINITY_DN8829_c0_g2_i2.p2 TRINITY_DN8829_c0_g2~~TRINITY_DN8829_c0_g2_i2.p2  ORF type:complete len:409 (+),score=108.69 TRINITY_DN8829_c0_g2_i2:78-1304(+)